MLILADVNFGLELIGAQPQHSASPSGGLDQAYQARNAETWESDLSPLAGFSEDIGTGDMGALRYDQAPPQLPGRSLVFCF
jgi:hypothetical protein